MKSIFRAPKTNLTMEKHPEQYYKQVWIDKQQDEVIAFLAKQNGVSKKRMLQGMLGLGIGLYLAGEVGEEMQDTYFDVVARHWAQWQLSLPQTPRASTLIGPSLRTDT